MTYVPYAFSDAQLVDVRRFCGYPAAASGQVLFPAPWVNVQYMALDYRLQTLSEAEGLVVVNTYLTPLYTLETAIWGASATLNVDVAAAFKRNAKEVRDRERLFATWRRKLCAFMGVEPGPGLGCGGLSLVV